MKGLIKHALDLAPNVHENAMMIHLNASFSVSELDNCPPLKNDAFHRKLISSLSYFFKRRVSSTLQH